jgi:NTP pyrophosphatase (non-canonical NTP hydrolase)
MSLSFQDLREANVRRCHEVFHNLDEWSLSDWGCALAGEVGEACNLIKKHRRGEDIDPDLIAEEVADAVIYADLLLARMGKDLGEAVRAKFNKVSQRRGSGIRL